MNRTATRPALYLLSLAFQLLVAGMVPAVGDVPRSAFSGVYGATSGAGALTGWERHGADNPAVFSGAGASASMAGYAPFGLDGLQVMETSAAFDRRRWGASLAWRGLFEDGHARASVSRVQGAMQVGDSWQVGGALLIDAGDEVPGIGTRPGAGLGILWQPASALHLGAAAEALSISSHHNVRAGLGADCGTRLGKKYAWRISVERAYFSDAAAEFRFGFGLRLHAQLSVYGGFVPARETASLGVRFGMGGFEGFSALRRHTSLGSTSIQGIQWNSGVR